MAKSLPSVDINILDLQWIQVLSEGWASPLKGFMREDQFLQCLHFDCLTMPKGTLINQSVPIVLPISEKDKSNLEGKSSISLIYKGQIVATLNRIEVYPHRKEERISRQFGTFHPDHPYVKVSLKLSFLWA